MFVADLHNDLVQRMMIGEDMAQNTSSGHTDIERLKLSSIDLGNDCLGFRKRRQYKLF